MSEKGKRSRTAQRRRRALSWSVQAALLFVGLASAPPVVADGPPYCVAVHADRGATYEIVLVAPEGGERILTHGQGRANNPSTTFDGSLLAFDRGGDVYLVLPDGTNLRRLTRDRKMNACPVLAGRGRWLAYQSNRDGQFEVYVADLMKGQERNVTAHRANDACPTLSPDGRWLAFVSDRDGAMQIYLMDLQSGAVRRLTGQGENMDPAFSRDARRIAFVSNRDGNFELYLMDVDGRNQRRLTWNETADLQPAFSPDSRAIYVERGGTIYRVPLDGGQEKRIHAGPAYVGGPAVLPCPEESPR